MFIDPARSRAIRKILIAPDMTVADAMHVIDVAPKEVIPSGIAVVVDENDYVLGTVTDGDIRRALIRGKGMDASVADVMSKTPICVQSAETPSAMLNSMTEQIKSSGKIRSDRVMQLPVVNEQKQIVDVVSFYELWLRVNVRNRRVCVLGQGFVGLTLSVTLADLGFSVVGYEVNTDVVNMLQKGEPHFYEKGLAPLLQSSVKSGRLRFTDNIEDAKSDIYIITVGTPLDGEKTPTMGYVATASEQIGAVLKYGDCVFLRSTVSVGTSREVVCPILEKTSGLSAETDFKLAFAPERTVEGSALEELKKLPQLVGGLTREATSAAADFFATMTSSIVRLASIEEAEMVKLINNSFRDLSFAFANEVSLICDGLQMDTERVIDAANRGYIRNNVPQASPGVGGACLCKDPYIMADAAKKAGIDLSLGVLGRAVNERIPQVIAEKIKDRYEQSGKAASDFKVFIIGFAFKGHPETSDMRDSVTLDLLDEIKGHGWTVCGYDPMCNPKDIDALGVSSMSLEEGAAGADMMLVMNNHQSYREINIVELVESMSKPGAFFDGWRMFSQDKFSSIDGIEYLGVGIG